MALATLVLDKVFPTLGRTEPEGCQLLPGEKQALSVNETRELDLISCMPRKGGWGSGGLLGSLVWFIL